MDEASEIKQLHAINQVSETQKLHKAEEKKWFANARKSIIVKKPYYDLDRDELADWEIVGLR